MPDEQKKKYYRNNRDERLKYQREYYRKNKQKILRNLEIKRVEDPDWAEAQRAYHRSYYLKNRDLIREKRLKKSD
jgi:hypothetical protein